MKLWYPILLIVDVVLVALLKLIELSLWETLLTIIIGELLLYILVTFLQASRFRHILDEECNPEKYLLKMVKQKERMKRKPKSLALLSINEAVAYMLLGDYVTAKGILSDIDKDNLSDKNGTLLVYTIDYILCCYELGELEEANRLYETQLPLLTLPGKRYRLAMQSMMGERYYFLGQYDECYQHMKKLLDIELSRRQQLGILYRLAKLDELRGDQEQAVRKYQKIAQYGNRLWIAKASEIILKGKSMLYSEEIT